ncbi:MAG TPA: hypothetical protein VM282_06635 [Acidimicrobiales bacterium]|nr:hypothetical protein [Acidimicrobiales bacterium]
MPELKFSARTHPELVRQVREWLATAEGERSMAHVITESSELTKDALRIIAAAAPAPVAESELVKTLTKLGYRATDLTRATLVAGLGSVSGANDGLMMKTAKKAGKTMLFTMSPRAAKQMRKLLG